MQPTSESCFLPGLPQCLGEILEKLARHGAADGLPRWAERRVQLFKQIAKRSGTFKKTKKGSLSDNGSTHPQSRFFAPHLFRCMPILSKNLVLQRRALFSARTILQDEASSRLALSEPARRRRRRENFWHVARAKGDMRDPLPLRTVQGAAAIRSLAALSGATRQMSFKRQECCHGYVCEKVRA